MVYFRKWATNPDEMTEENHQYLEKAMEIMQNLSQYKPGNNIISDGEKKALADEKK